jgi:hypothetical protein
LEEFMKDWWSRPIPGNGQPRPRAWKREELHEREQLRKEIIEGCRDMADVYLEVEREYHPLEEEVQR